MRIHFLLTGLLLSFCLQAQTGVDAHVPGRLIVHHRDGVSEGAAAKAFAQHGARVRSRQDKLGFSVIEVPESSAESIARSLRANPLFRNVEYDYYARPAATPNDPSFSSEWHLSKIQAPAAWNISTGSAIPIAVVDSGIDSSHPDLSGRVLPGWNFVYNNSNTSDLTGHGTAVAGAVAASANNWIGVAGVTWNNPILPLVAVDGSNYAAYSNIAGAITYAVDHGARVINVSLGGTAPSAALQSAVDYAWNAGALVIAAALNNSSSTPVYPAACNHAVGVSATDENDNLAGFSDYGSWITVAAPGNNIATTNNGGGYGMWWGTSLATPVVSGVAALALGANPSLSAQQLLTLLQQNADDLGAPGFDNQFGYGRVNAYRTVSAAAGLGTPPPPPPPPPPSGSFTPIRVNAGGGSYTDANGNNWVADYGYSGGNSWYTNSPVSNTASSAIYQSCRYGSFSYTFSVPNGSYTVNLKFAEVSQFWSGGRVFNVAINGAAVLTNFDIFASTGGLTALDKSFPVSVSNGQITIQFNTGWANSPLVNGIEITQGSGGGSGGPGTTASAIRVNAGGPGYTDANGNAWAADYGFSGGNTWSTGSSVSNTNSPALYQTCRYGVFGYTFNVPNGNYKVNLKFAEVSQFWNGGRVFNVSINGAPVLANFDIYAKAGGLTALDQSFPVSVGNGQISIQFTNGWANSPLVNAIEIIPQ